MHGLDLAVILGYVAAMMWMGARLGAGTEGLKGYFLGDANVPAWAVMLSIVATETSTATFLSVPAVAFAEGGNFTYLQLAMGYMMGRVVVASLLLPAYFRGEIFTAYEVLQRRFGGATKTTASVMFLVARTLGDGLRLFLAAKVVQELMLMGGWFDVGGERHGGWSMPLAIVLMGVTTLIYTYVGGMKAVVWTDVVQFFIYMAGAFVALWILVDRIPGGWGELLERGEAAGKFRLFDFSLDLTKTYTFWAGVVGGTVVNCATHGADQLMVQRYLSARSRGQAAAALVSSGFVVFGQFALFLLIGVGLFALFQVSPPERELSKDGEFAYFLVRHMPPGMLGLVVAAIFSAAMSTLSSSLNSSAATTVNDLLKPNLKGASERTLLRWSKGLTVIWGLAQMGVAFYASEYLTDNVVNNALAIASFVTGIVLGLFLLGMASERVGQGAAMCGMVAGLGAVSYAKFGPLLKGVGLYPFEGAVAWPWYALIGSGTVVAVGLAAGSFGARQRDLGGESR